MSLATAHKDNLEAPAAEPKKYPRVWPVVVAATLYWAFYFLSKQFGLDLGTLFFSRLGACAAGILFAVIWWWTSFRIPLRDRAIGAAVFVVSVVAAAYLSDKSIGGFGMFLYGLPVAFTAGAIALLLARQASDSLRRTLVLLATGGACFAFTLIRMDGVQGNADANFSWRWSLTAEERYLAQREPAEENRDPVIYFEPLAAQAGDWTEFRGPNRAGAVTAGEIQGNWNESPPPLVWKIPVGPAWSSLIIVQGLLFTQEQRGEKEAVVCYEAETGREVWSHEAKARYWDAVSGAGPRATPTFADGKLYTFGSTGELCCLDAASGSLLWQRETLTSEKLQQIWGFASSPLVTDGVVIVYGGGTQSPGEQRKRDTLVAFDAATGEPRWQADGGQVNFTSAEMATVGGKSVMLFAGELGVQAFDPTSGQSLWKWGTQRPNESHSLQPHVVRSEKLGERIYMVTSLGLEEGKVLPGNGLPEIQTGWLSKHLRPDFNDFVVQNGYAYGFDGEIFACVNLSDGKRTWKKGRYGHGQVILLEDLHQLLILSESGEATLLAANPKKHEELGKFPAIRGKTWNHPVIAHGRLYLRNAEEMACYDLR